MQRELQIPRTRDGSNESPACVVTSRRLGVFWASKATRNGNLAVEPDHRHSGSCQQPPAKIELQIEKARCGIAREKTGTGKLNRAFHVRDWRDLAQSCVVEKYSELRFVDGFGVPLENSPGCKGRQADFL